MMAGDYQTVKRMQQKREAVPLPDLEGLTVLDVGCDHGEWCRIASDAGAARVVGVDKGREVRGAGFVDLVARNREQGWPRCEFVQADLGKEWPDLGAFDVVLALSIYHHLFRDAHGHVPVWCWLRRHTADDGVLLWEGPVNTQDSMGRRRAREAGLPYTRAGIMDAAQEYYHVEHVGPAIHRRHREVWRCRAKGQRPERIGSGGAGVDRAAAT